MKLQGSWLSRPATAAVLAALSAKGHRVLFVGGCVRNAIIGQPIADIDLATDATPETVLELAAAAGLRTVPTGLDHGTVTVILRGVAHEVTTFRRDVETFGRHATVAYSTLIDDDARRRDFTMNALYAEPDGTVVDPLGGLDDALARRVRFIEDPVARIREDYLRILRFFRFHAWYGNPAAGLDPEGLAACAAEAEGLETLSRERVGAEMVKLLSAPDPAPAMAAFAVTGGLARILPGADPSALSILVAAEFDIGAEINPVRRLALIGGEGPVDRFRLSRFWRRRLRGIAGSLALSPAVAGYRHGALNALDAALIAAASSGRLVPNGVKEEVARGAAAEFPVKAADLPTLIGPVLGERLKTLETRWIESDFSLSREELLATG